LRLLFGRRRKETRSQSGLLRLKIYKNSWRVSIHSRLTVVYTRKNGGSCKGYRYNRPMELYFSQYFNVPREMPDEYGAFDISVGLRSTPIHRPVPLFHSEKSEYEGLHESILTYLRFLRDEATGSLDRSLISSWYQCKEVKQNWLGFTVLGNGGDGLGPISLSRSAPHLAAS